MSVAAEWEWARAPPPERPLWHRAALALYDPGSRSVLGRNAKRWGILLVFYGVFYAGLAALLGACVGGLLLTLDAAVPKHTLGASLIGDSPGVSSRPRDRLHPDNRSSELTEFLRPYEAAPWFRALRGCKPEDDFGGDLQPCLYVKVNRLFGWEPQYYERLPDDAPQDLRDHVAELPPQERRAVWVSCAGEGGAVSLEYPWGRSLAERFFPFRNQREYLSPLVAVRLQTNAEKPRAVRCRAWAANIRHDPSLKEPRGYARILL